MKLHERVKENDRIKITKGDGSVDGSVYKVVGRKMAIIVLEDEATGKPHRVHKSRIHEILEEGTMNTLDSADVVAEETKPAEPQAAETKKAKKPKKAPKTAKKPEKVVFKEFVRQGFEVWSKRCKFPGKDGEDQESIKVESHCLIAPDKKSFRTFNTYNGTMGKRNSKKKHPEGVSYPLADEAAYEKKAKALKKGGYKRRK